jgi:hypothetical protein
MKDYQGVHVHRILQGYESSKHAVGGLQRTEDGDCGLQKTEIEKLQNSQ